MRHQTSSETHFDLSRHSQCITVLFEDNSTQTLCESYQKFTSCEVLSQSISLCFDNNGIVWGFCQMTKMCLCVLKSHAFVFVLTHSCVCLPAHSVSPFWKVNKVHREESICFPICGVIVKLLSHFSN